MRKYSKYSEPVFYLSLVALFFSFWGWAFFDIWLSSSTWLLVGIYLIGLSIYLKGERR